MIEHIKISLFDVPKDEVLIHACNAKGMWGSGIAKEFNKRYPGSYKDYQLFCKEHGTGEAGLSTYPVDEAHWIGWIITSEDYGSNKDPKEVIKINTTLALNSLCKLLYKAHDDNYPIDVYSNKFNSGLFNVPWEESELILKTVLKRFKRINWYICDPQGKN